MAYSRSPAAGPTSGCAADRLVRRGSESWRITKAAKYRQQAICLTAKSRPSESASLRLSLLRRRRAGRSHGKYDDPWFPRSVEDSHGTLRGIAQSIHGRTFQRMKAGRATVAGQNRGHSSFQVYNRDRFRFLAADEDAKAVVRRCYAGKAIEPLAKGRDR